MSKGERPSYAKVSQTNLSEVRVAEVGQYYSTAYVPPLIGQGKHSGVREGGHPLGGESSDQQGDDEEHCGAQVILGRSSTQPSKSDVLSSATTE
jgi:hypothetical protein